MSKREQHFQLPNDVEHYLAALAKLYAQEGERQKLEVIVNAQVRVHEAWTYDDYEGTFGHALYLTVPETLYLSVVKERRAVQNAIAADLNKIHNVRNEFIAEVLLEMEKVQDRDWRTESGVLHSRQRVISSTTADRIWGDDGYRMFLSHKAEVKKNAAELKEALAVFGVSCFVAHQDIPPTKEWQDEIENALASMDAFVALLTERFHDSMWTDQEVGYALARGVSMIAVKLGKDPYGFIGKFQALACGWEEAPVALVKLLVKQPRMLDAYITALPKCMTFEQGNTLAQVLPSIESVTEEQAQELVSAFNHNSQLQGSFGFNGARPYMYGDGLATHLSRATGEEYVMTASGQIKIKKR
ncbi:MAG: TIR domain-containing protein [Acidobacteria bacterium RIFCSPHIGHO2_02_FULL_67_57]|nr:MAG: TIR domain-containing protein [Acidobacteria bacterium RIFCSPHIGHO2_02_FULL_67_57]